MLQARAEQSSSTQKTTASVRSCIWSLKTLHNESLQLAATQTAAVDNGTQAECLKENSRLLAKGDTVGAGAQSSQGAAFLLEATPASSMKPETPVKPLYRMTNQESY